MIRIEISGPQGEGKSTIIKAIRPVITALKIPFVIIEKQTID